MTRSHQNGGNKRKNQSSPASRMDGARNVRRRLAQSSPAPVLRSSPPPLLQSHIDPFHPENVNWPSTHEDVDLWLATVATSDFRQNPALVVRTIQKIINIDLHWESILEVQGRRILAYLNRTGAPEDLKEFVNKTLHDELSFKLCWILGGKVKNAAHLAQQHQTLQRASETFHGPLITPDHRELFQEITSAWSLPAAGPASDPLRRDSRLDAENELRGEAGPSNREPHTNWRPEHHTERRRASLPANGTGLNHLPEALAERRGEISPSSQPDPAPVPALQPDDPPRRNIRRNSKQDGPPPNLKRMDRTGVKRSLAPRIAWFLNEEHWRKVKGDFFPDLLADAKTLWAWYKLDKLVEAAGTSNAYRMHVEDFWNALDKNARDAWENRFARIRIDRISIEHIRQRLEISGASLASSAPALTISHSELPAPLDPSPPAAPTTSSQLPDVKVEIIDISRDDDEVDKQQKANLKLAGNHSAARRASPGVTSPTPGPSNWRTNRRPESLSREQRAATPKSMARRGTPAPTQSNGNDPRSVTHGSYSGVAQRGQQGAGRSINQSRPPGPACGARPRHKSFTAINRPRSRGPSTQPPNVETSQRNAPSSRPSNGQNGPTKSFKRNEKGQFRSKTPFPHP